MPPASTCGRSIAFNGQLLSLQFRHAMKTPPQPRKSIVVIKRSAKRWFKNHDQICQMIRKVVRGTDIKVEIFSDKKLPTFEQTMAIFNRAFMVIGPHGAGQTNLFFSEEGTVNLEGQCVIHGTANLCYKESYESLRAPLLWTLPRQRLSRYTTKTVGRTCQTIH